MTLLTSFDVEAEVASYEGKQYPRTYASQYRDCVSESLHSPLVSVRRKEIVFNHRVIRLLASHSRASLKRENYHMTPEPSRRRNCCSAA